VRHRSRTTNGSEASRRGCVSPVQFVHVCDACGGVPSSGLASLSSMALSNPRNGCVFSGRRSMGACRST
jgi:hypothetical protein